jgi:hypothetical protein
MLAFYDTPSDALMREYTTMKTDLPKALLDANAFLTKAAALSQALAKSSVTLTVPAPVK